MNDEDIAHMKSKAKMMAAFACAVPLAFVATPAVANKQEVDVKPTTLDVRDVGEIYGTEHTIMVPENRQDPASRLLALRYVVLPAVTPSGKTPVVYLAGGPGGAATQTAESRRWPLFDALRQSRDVILLDQRGTGRSESPPPCASSVGWTPQDIGDRDTFVEKQKAAFEICEQFWLENGVDLRGYTTAESAADLVEVANRHGGKVSLLGISYGTHLALATMKASPHIIDRVVLVGVEGLDQTVKLPARTDAYLERLQLALDTSAMRSGTDPYPELKAELRKALERIERDKPVVEVFLARGEPPVKRTLGPFAVQAAIAFSLADPDDGYEVAQGILAMAADEPDYGFMRFRGFVMPDDIRMRAMSSMMDLASGISEERLATVKEQATEAALSDATNFPLPHLEEEMHRYMLPNEFRQRFSSTTPTLVISGTLDGRTYPESAEEATELFENRSFLTVENAGHNLFFVHPEILPSIISFMNGEELREDRISAPLPAPR